MFAESLKCVVNGGCLMALGNMPSLTRRLASDLGWPSEFFGQNCFTKDKRYRLVLCFDNSLGVGAQFVRCCYEQPMVDFRPTGL